MTDNHKMVNYVYEYEVTEGDNNCPVLWTDRQ